LKLHQIEDLRCVFSEIAATGLLPRWQVASPISAIVLIAALWLHGAPSGTKQNKFRGVMQSPVTPLKDDYSLDLPTFESRASQSS